MRPGDRSDLIEVFRLAELGQLQRRDITAALMYVRGEAAQGSVLRDLGDAVAHDERTRGVAHANASAIVQNFRDVMTHGGVLGGTVIYPIQQLLDELLTTASRLEIPVDQSAFRSHWQLWVRLLADLLDGTTIRIAGVQGQLRGGVRPTFQFHFLEPVHLPVLSLTMAPSLTLAFPMLVDEDEFRSTLSAEELEQYMRSERPEP